MEKRKFDNVLGELKRRILEPCEARDDVSAENLEDGMLTCTCMKFETDGGGSRTINWRNIERRGEFLSTLDKWNIRGNHLLILMTCVVFDKNVVPVAALPDGFYS